MELDKLVIQTRVRNPWAAIDLGFKLAKPFWLRCVAVYAVLVLPLFGLLFFALDEEWRWLSMFVFWWLKPLFERPLLFIFSRELFQQQSGFAHSLSNYKQWWSQGLLPALTYRRLSPSRSMFAPISVLEGATGATYSQRAQILGATYSNSAMWLTFVLFHFEYFFVFSLYSLVALFAPEWVSSVFDGFTSSYASDVWSDLLANLMGASVIIAMAPFYVASGFMLYISRRIELEGWDIEICFREWLQDSEARKLVTRPKPKKLKA